MPSAQRIRAVLLVVLSGVLLALALIFALRETMGGDRRRLQGMLPKMDPEIAECLLGDDEDAFRAYSREFGFRALRDTEADLLHALRYGPTGELPARAEFLLPLLGRVARRLADDYGYQAGLLGFDHLSSQSSEALASYARLSRESHAVYHDPALGPAEKVERLIPIAEALGELGFLRSQSASEEGIATWMDQLGRGEEKLRYLHRAIAHARAARDDRALSQVLGVLGFHHKTVGRIDSMMVCWDEARQVAKRCQMPEYSARILVFYAHYYRSLGRMALAAELFDEAQRVCREYKGGYRELRFLSEEMAFQAFLGCWELIGRELPRAQLILEEIPGSDPESWREIYPQRLALIEASYRLAGGELDRAEEIFGGLREPMRRMTHRDDYANLLETWSRALAGKGLYERALPIYEEGLRYSRENRLHRYAASFLSGLARARLETGDPDAAEKDLDAFAALPPRQLSGSQQEWIEHDLLRARLALAAGDSATALGKLEQGLTRLVTTLGRTQPGLEGYLVLAANKGLLESLLDLSGGDPARSYAIEMSWRGLPRRIGDYRGREVGTAAHRSAAAPRRREPAEPANEVAAGILSLLRSDEPPPAAAVLRWCRASGGRHILYHQHGGSVLRWMAGPAAIICDTLAIPPAELRGRLGRLLPLLSADPQRGEDALGPELSAPLRALAREILPAELRAAGSNGSALPLLITPDDVLSQLPFEALDLGDAEDYVPLIQRCDVAYLHSLAPRKRGAAGGPGIVLTAPALAPEMCRRYPQLQDLAEGREEAEKLRGLRPGALLLAESAAHKEALLSRWESAAFVYFATHLLRDPEMPYRSFLPLSNSAGSIAPDASYLDLADILGADLSACGLVVLSGCETGVPYITAHHAAPSLADAFVDAGAGSVIQTFWPVRDDAAGLLMGQFIESWAGEGTAAITALADARRAAMRGPVGIRHPFTWAAYAIQLGGFP